MELTQNLIKELFFYEEGKLFNRAKRNSKVLAGDEAGSLKNTGYRRIGINGKFYLSHRLIYIYHKGEIDNKLQIDHIDRDKSNNNIENLRLVTRQENGFNTDAKGYYFNKARNKFQAQIKINGEPIHLGCFNSEKEARATYLEAKERLHIIEERI
jgi:hypothetical protein